MKDKTLKEKYEAINDILDLAEGDILNMDFNSQINKICFLSDACKCILQEFRIMQSTGINNKARISTKRIVSVSTYVNNDDYDKETIKEDLKEILDKFSPIPLQINDITIKKTDVNKWKVSITVSMI